VRRGARVDLVSLASGAVIVALGVLVLLDSSDAIEVSVGWASVALAAAVGVIVLLSGLVDGSEDRHD
jgi:hypothetical protein